MKRSGRMRFAIFVRVSSKGQTKGESPRVQRKLGEQYVSRNGAEVVKVYDGVESGTKPLADRGLLQEVLRDALSGQWDALWVLDQSRLTRSPDTLLAIASAFKVSGLELHTNNGRTQLETPEGELHAGIQSQSDRYFAQKITQRTRHSRLELLSKGRHAFGRHPWGRIWDKESDEWLIDRKKHALIQKAYALYIDEDLSIADVAKRLPGIGPNQKHMAKSSLAKAFRSAASTDWPRTLQTPDGPRNFVHKLPALLSAAQGLAIKRRSLRNATVRPGTKKARSLLQGVIRCWHCGGNLSRMPSRKGGGVDYPVYRHLPSTRKAKCLWHVPATLIEDSAVQACAEIVRDSKLLVTAIKLAMTTQQTGAKEAEIRLSQIEKEMVDSQRRLDRAQVELLNLKGSEAACIELRNEIKRASALIEERTLERRELSDRLASLSSPIRDPKALTARLQSLIGFGGYSSVTMLTHEQKRQLVLLMIGRDKQASPNGVFVHMSRKNGPRTGLWHWELRGTLAIAEGATSQYDLPEATSAIVRRRNDPEPAAIAKLAELARTLKPTVVKSSRSSSSGA